MAIKGLGTDIVEIARFCERFERSGAKLAQRLLTEAEQQQLADSSEPARFLAKRFAAKEAASKALGTGIGRGVSFQHFEVSHTEFGAPVLTLTDGAAARLAAIGASHCHISLSDERDYVVATVIVES